MNERILIKRDTLNKKVEKQLRKMIVNGVWKPGDKLPSETELTEIFGVSRMTIRMALQTLSANRVIYAKAGEGTYVREFSISSYLNAASDLYVTPELIEDAYDFRKLVEVECAVIACERATEEDIAQIQRANDNFIQVVKSNKTFTESGLKQRVSADLDFHHSICKATHNKIYELSFEATRGVVAQHLEMIVRQRVLTCPNIDYIPWGRFAHQQILDAIKKRDSELCRQIYLVHVDHHITIEEYEAKLISLNR